MNDMKRVLAAVALAGAVLSFGGAAQADGGGNWAINQGQSRNAGSGGGATAQEDTTIDNDTSHEVSNPGVVSDALDSLGLQ
ncbi:hypothetical protein OG389_30815 [Streptomyces sp. NBC_00435]|uniref:hypothetical protein n=1 Tax=Streptomyces sp. NBC_00435 TaxID=2903649 RepID=UPI002E238CF0